MCILLDSTFNFLDSTLQYTTSSTNFLSAERIVPFRTKVEEALEQFFEIYTRMRENPSHSTLSNTDAIHLNIFILLILRLVHLTVTAAETSQTPGAALDIDRDLTENVPKMAHSINWKEFFSQLAVYIGIRPSL